jgi:hypothetical protein
MDNKAWVTTLPFIAWLAEYFEHIVENYRSEKKKIPFQIFLLIDNVPSHPRALLEMYNAINAILTSADTHRGSWISSLAFEEIPSTKL